MRESTIILPNYDKDGKATDHSVARRFFARNFGGYTAATAAGGWMNADGELIEEAVTVYTLAMVPTLANVDKLARYAAIMADWFDQDCIYVRFPHGHVVLIDANGNRV